MFTGIIQAVGTVERIDAESLTVRAPSGYATDGFAFGESVALNGCCLTVVGAGPLKFDVSPETWRRTALGALQPGDPVNIERAMAVGDRFGGHIVQGHVDATATIGAIGGAMDGSNEFVVMHIAGPVEGDRYLIDKGSVSVDGISLTVVSPERGAFDVWLIPHTLANTNLRAKGVGDSVNIEFDVIGKYVEKLVSRPI